ncbi:hypothetical protein EDC01DRAFT_165492 [Geopyxis carbonaria]|nr:hypothetical protein EDC01DRAFT_165492 [Geopyxis carbonaria]
MTRQAFNFTDPVVSKWVSGTDQIHGIPNFFSPTNLGKTSQIRGAAQILAVAATVATVLRVFARRRAKTPLGRDDVCALLAALLLIANENIFTAVFLLGREAFAFISSQPASEEAARLAHIVVGLKLSLAFEVGYLASIFLVKASMLFLYDRFARQTRGITLYLRITQGLCLVTFAACILSLFLSCVPINMFWSLHVSNRECTRRTLLTYTSGISNIVTNTLVLAVPVPLLLRATLTRRQKLGLAVLYFFGAFVIIAAALRFVTQLLAVGIPQAMAWSQLEVALALILASAPMAVKLLIVPLEDPATALAAPARDPEKAVLARLRERKEPVVAPRAQRSVAFSLPGHPPPSVSASEYSVDDEDEEVDDRVVSADYNKLRLVKQQVNGQSVWEVC